MSYPAAVALTMICIAGFAVLSYGVQRVRALLRFLGNSVQVVAEQLPDRVSPMPRGFATVIPAIYQRQAQFLCPVTHERRIVAETVTSSRQSQWFEGQTIPVRVSLTPPHAAAVATIRNLYVFPVVYVLAGLVGALLIPFAILSA